MEKRNCFLLKILSRKPSFLKNLTNWHDESLQCCCHTITCLHLKLLQSLAMFTSLYSLWDPYKLCWKKKNCFFLKIFYFPICLTSNRFYWIADQLANVSTRFYSLVSWHWQIDPLATWLNTKGDVNESVKYMDEGRRRELNDRMMEGTKRLSLKEKRKKEGGIKEGRNWEGRSYKRKEGGTVVVHRQADNYLVWNPLQTIKYRENNPKALPPHLLHKLFKSSSVVPGESPLMYRFVLLSFSSGSSWLSLTDKLLCPDVGGGLPGILYACVSEIEKKQPLSSREDAFWKITVSLICLIYSGARKA